MRDVLRQQQRQGRAVLVDRRRRAAAGITQQPAGATVALGERATFTVVANGAGPLRYQWQRDGADIAGATSATYTIDAAARGDDGATFRVIVSNDASSTASDPATLLVTSDAALTATITALAAGATFAGGDTITFAGEGADAEDGTLPDAAFSWRVEYHTGDVARPFVPETPGARGVVHGGDRHAVHRARRLLPRPPHRDGFRRPVDDRHPRRRARTADHAPLRTGGRAAHASTASPRRRRP